MKVTIKALAEAAGVSRGTVDRVLHNRGSVKEEVANKILSLAKELGYVPNRAGIALASVRTPMKIGAMLPSIGNPFFDDVKEGLYQAQREFEDLGLVLELEELEGFNDADHLKSIDRLLDKGCKALCLATIDTKVIADKIDELVDNGIKVILLNSDVLNSKRLCFVGPDYKVEGATSAAMLSLCKKENLKILIITGSKLMLGHNQRIAGFKDELSRLHVDYQIVDILESSDSDIKAQQITQEALEKYQDINCIYVCGAALQGVGAAVIASNRTDLFVMGFDELYTTKCLIKAGIVKFVICQQPQRQGYHAVKRAFMALTNQLQEKQDNFITDTIIKVEANLS